MVAVSSTLVNCVLLFCFTSKTITTISHCWVTLWSSSQFPRARERESLASMNWTYKHVQSQILWLPARFDQYPLPLTNIASNAQSLWTPKPNRDQQQPLFAWMWSTLSLTVKPYSLGCFWGWFCRASHQQFSHLGVFLWSADLESLAVVVRMQDVQ